jgi:hypothetical protein
VALIQGWPCFRGVFGGSNYVNVSVLIWEFTESIARRDPLHLPTNLFYAARELTSDLSHVIPLKKQQGFLNMMGQMVTTLGPKLLPHLSRLLAIVTHLGAAASSMLDQKHQVTEGGGGGGGGWREAGEGEGERGGGDDWCVESEKLAL